MSKVHYVAAYADECLMVCNHEHETVIGAMDCITWAGGYVIAVEGGKFRAVTDVEKSTAVGRIKRKFNAERLHPARTSCRITKKLTAEGRMTRQEFARWLGMRGAA
jgi:hypothetical protein